MWLLLLLFFLNHSLVRAITTNANKSDKEVGGEVVFEVWDGGNDYVPLTPVGK